MGPPVSYLAPARAALQLTRRPSAKPAPLRPGPVCSIEFARPSVFATTAAGPRTPTFARIRRYILFHGKRHPAGMGATELTAFLSSLAVDHHVAASTRTSQNQPLSALRFLYRDVLKLEVPWLD